MAVKKKRPPLTSLNSWYRKAIREKKQKSTARIMRAWTAWIQSGRTHTQSRKLEAGTPGTIAERLLGAAEPSLLAALQW